MVGGVGLLLVDVGMVVHEDTQTHKIDRIYRIIKRFFLFGIYFKVTQCKNIWLNI